MAGEAGFRAKLYVAAKAQNLVFKAVPATNPTLSDTTNNQDVTTTLTNGTTEFIYTLQTWSMNGDGIYVPGADDGYAVIKTAKETRSLLVAQWVPKVTGANFVPSSQELLAGVQGDVLVSNFDIGTDVNGALTVSCTLQGTGDLSVATR